MTICHEVKLNMHEHIFVFKYRFVAICSGYQAYNTAVLCIGTMDVYRAPDLNFDAHTYANGVLQLPWPDTST